MTPRGCSPPGVSFEMRIAESEENQNTLTKCSKMTEEGHRRHGMNGSIDEIVVVKNEVVAVKDEVVAVKDEFHRTAYTQGGRLKFFKDGKFILELERAREGERVSWVSVPRKTYWPPQANAASTPTYRQESSTSLSMSDDNSSIQSSPWQRDHSWKQTNPRHNISKEMAFFYWLPKKLNVPKPVSRIRRHPYKIISTLNSGPDSYLSGEKTKNTMCNKTHVRPPLKTVIQMLIDRIGSPITIATATKTDMVVSPRKRFLREMEKDKMQIDDACQKRSRNKSQPLNTAAGVILPTSSTANIKVGSPVRMNGNTEEARPPRNSSYSITSLLAEDRSSRRSPEKSPSHFTQVTQTQYCSPPPEDPWYSESVDRLRSIELSQVDKRGLSAAYSSYPYMSPYIYPYSLPPYYSPEMYGRGFMVPSVYPTPPLSVPVRQDAPTCSWAAEVPKDSEHREDITDMPLNLSKHAG